MPGLQHQFFNCTDICKDSANHITLSQPSPNVHTYVHAWWIHKLT